MSEARTCANCACFARMLEDGTILAEADERLGQPVCRRNEPGAKYVSAPVPIKGADGQPWLDNKGQPRTQMGQKLLIGYRPITPEAVCFDGWRPLGTLPGQWPAFGRVS